jgi:hypothetical protein
VPRLLVAGSERIGTITRAGENEAGENKATRRGDMSSERLIDYEALAQDAMRGVVRTILTRVGKTGLPGDHHFYISFNTSAEGVSISKRLKEKYRDEMTIVLQHRFWDLLVTDDRFEVKLTFDGIPERLVVPFRAIKVFFDPSVRYGLQFESPDFGPDATAHPAAVETADIAEAGSRSGPATGEAGPGTRNAERKPRPARKPRVEKTTEPVAERDPATKPLVEEPPAKPQRPLAAVAKSDGAAAGAVNTPKPAAGNGAQVVSLDAFRKK